jgi:NADPH:quinone reductase-like Zn-dependent oxidoreductase
MFGLSAAATGKKRSVFSLLGAAMRMPRRFTPLRLMDANKGVFGVNVGHLWNETDRVAGWMEALLEQYSGGALRPVVDCSFPFAEAAAAHHYIQDRKNFGKVLLTP